MSALFNCLICRCVYPLSAEGCVGGKSQPVAGFQMPLDRPHQVLSLALLVEHLEVELERRAARLRQDGNEHVGAERSLRRHRETEAILVHVGVGIALRKEVLDGAVARQVDQQQMAAILGSFRQAPPSPLALDGSHSVVDLVTCDDCGPGSCSSDVQCCNNRSRPWTQLIATRSARLQAG